MRTPDINPETYFEGKYKIQKSKLDLSEYIPKDLIEIANVWPVPLYVAGGFIRDLFLDLKNSSSDIDLASSLVPDEIKELADSINSLGYISRGSSYGSCIVRSMSGTTSYDHTTLRSETYHKDSRLPTVNKGSVGSDLYRRDSTINSVLYDITNKVLYWHPKFFVDMTNRTIRSTGNPFITRFDDPLRIVRDYRFLSSLPNSKISFMTKLANLYYGRFIREKVSKERLTIEINKIQNFNTFVSLLKKANLYYCVFDFDIQTPLMQSCPAKHPRLFWADLSKGDIQLLKDNFVLSKRTLDYVRELFRYSEFVEQLSSPFIDLVYKQYLLRRLHEDLKYVPIEDFLSYWGIGLKMSYSLRNLKRSITAEDFIKAGVEPALIKIKTLLNRALYLQVVQNLEFNPSKILSVCLDSIKDPTELNDLEDKYNTHLNEFEAIQNGLLSFEPSNNEVSTDSQLKRISECISKLENMYSVLIELERHNKLVEKVKNIL